MNCHQPNLPSSKTTSFIWMMTHLSPLNSCSASPPTQAILLRILVYVAFRIFSNWMPTYPSLYLSQTIVTTTHFSLVELDLQSKEFNQHNLQSYRIFVRPQILVPQTKNVEERKRTTYVGGPLRIKSEWKEGRPTISSSRTSTLPRIRWENS
jgi:hypothetical protein